jgi:hypothetical protein
MGPNGGGSDALGGPDGVRGVIGRLPPDQITADLNAVPNRKARNEGWERWKKILAGLKPN